MNAHDILQQIEATQAAMRAQTAALGTFSPTAMDVPEAGANATDMMQNCMNAQWSSAGRSLQLMAGAEQASRSQTKPPQTEAESTTENIIDVEFKEVPKTEAT
jgi:hypothetical protein